MRRGLPRLFRWMCSRWRDGVLAAKHANPSADTGALEREIDARVYRLYGLTDDEIAKTEAQA